MSSHQEVLRYSLEKPEQFWAEQAECIEWYRPWDKVLDRTEAPLYRWFAGGMLNTCYNALDVHVERGRGEQAALIYDSPVTDTGKTYSYKELRDAVAKLAGAMQAHGVVHGDRVIIYMPMIPEAVMAMLACARLGAIHSVVFGGFAANELAVRIDDAKPKMVLSASCGIEGSRVIPYKPLLDSAIEASTHKPTHCYVLQRNQQIAPLVEGRDYDWNDVVDSAVPSDCTPVAATDPLYILYTSGTTGQPKGVVRDNGGHAVALKWSMSNIYNMQPGEVFWAASDVGWVVGHSYIAYAPLLMGCTTLVYEGKPVGTPDPGAFWRVIAEHDVRTLFAAPTAIRVIRKEDPEATYLSTYDTSKLRALFLAGERCDPDTLQWAQEKLQIPVIDHWWQTETGWAIAANCLGLEQLPVKPGSPSLAVPGYDVCVLNESGEQLPAGDMGSIAIKLPLPPGCLPTLWGNDERYREAYLSTYPGHYLTGDAGFIDSEGYLYIMSRTDDVINVAGHRLSTGAMEEVLTAHPDVAECAVIGPYCPLKGQAPLGLVVLKSGVDRDDADIVKELVQSIRERIGPVAAFKDAIVVQRLPKTRSGKVLRATMKQLADGDDYKVPPTIDDPEILNELAASLIPTGYPRR